MHETLQYKVEISNIIYNWDDGIYQTEVVLKFACTLLTISGVA